MTIAPRILVSLALPLALVGCDKVQSLVGGDAEKADADKPDADKSDADKSDADKSDADKSDADKADSKKAASDEADSKEAASDEPAPDAPADADKADENAEAEADAAPEAEATPEAEAAPEAAGEQPCIVGHWEATDYLAEINRALRKDPTLKSMKYKSKSGTIGYVVEPAGPDGKGTVRANADNLSYKYAGKVQGIGVSLSVTMKGDITASYTLEEPSRIVVDKPTENNMRVSARIKLQGLGKHRDSKKVRHQFDGDFPYECSDTELKVYTDGKDRKPLTFERLDE